MVHDSVFCDTCVYRLAIAYK